MINDGAAGVGWGWGGRSFKCSTGMQPLVVMN